MLKIINEKIKNSSIHAIPNIVRSRSMVLKFLWTVCFLVSSCLCAYSITKTIGEYLKFPVVTNFYETNENPIIFPVISMCKSNFLEDELIDEINLQKLALDYDIKLHSMSNESESSNYSDLRKNLLFLQYVGMNNAFLVKDSISNRYKNKLKNDFLISCIFNFMPCKNEDFDIYYDFKYGYCLRYNNLEQKKTSTQRGSRDGLILELWVNPTNDKKNNFITNSGIQLFISNKSVGSNQEEGIKLMGGFSFDIKLNKYSIFKLPKPYSDCDGDLKDIDDHDSIYFKQSLKSNNYYTYQTCIILCAQEYINKSCNCETIGFPRFNSNNQVCVTPIQNICLLKHYNIYLKEKIFQNCSCPLECEKHGYFYQMSFSDYPTEWYSKYLLKSLVILSKYNPNETITFEKLKKNVISVNIFYDEFKHMIINQEEKMKLFDLISNVGGTLGLFLGMSFLSFIEIFELIIEICLFKIMYLKKKSIKGAQKISIATEKNRINVFDLENEKNSVSHIN